jgi:Ca2+-binding EF-hand superfamily protein
MKSTHLMILGALLGATALAGAQDGPKKEGRPDRPVPKEILEKFDADKDGKLSKEEREAARAAREKEFDKDGDGKLSDEEKKAMREDGRKKMLEKFDKDGDGKLSDEEKASVPKGPRGEKGPKDDTKAE